MSNNFVILIDYLNPKQEDKDKIYSLYEQSLFKTYLNRISQQLFIYDKQIEKVSDPDYFNELKKTQINTIYNFLSNKTETDNLKIHTSNLSKILALDDDLEDFKDIDDDVLDILQVKMDDICDPEMTKDNYIDKILTFCHRIGFKDKFDKDALLGVNTLTNNISDINKIISYLPGAIESPIGDQHWGQKPYTNIKFNYKGKDINVIRDSYVLAKEPNQYKAKTSSLLFPEVIVKTGNLQNYTFKELINHIILYIVNRCNIGKKEKFVATPIYVCIIGNNITMILEKGSMNLNTYFDSLKHTLDEDATKKKIRNMIYLTYKTLYNFYDKSKSKLDTFYQGEYTPTYIFIKDNKPIMSDFLKTSLKLFDLEITTKSKTFIEDYNILLSNIKSFNVGKINTIIQSDNNNVEKQELKDFIQFTPTKNIKKRIIPDELKELYGIDDDDSKLLEYNNKYINYQKNINYKNKYLKYKKKYLLLKNLIL